MNVSVSFFGPLRRNGALVDYPLDAGATVRELRARICAARPADAALLARSVFATEREIIAEDTPLDDGARLSVLPPVCGG